MSNYAEELRRRVDEILYYIWDPIGVAAEPSTRDEYERYVAGLISLLEKNADSKQVAAYLDEIAKNRMGLHPNDKHSLAVARLVLAWKSWLLKRWPLASDRDPSSMKE
jgi:hypothetical protein